MCDTSRNDVVLVVHQWLTRQEWKNFLSSHSVRCVRKRFMWCWNFGFHFAWLYLSPCGSHSVEAWSKTNESAMFCVWKCSHPVREYHIIQKLFPSKDWTLCWTWGQQQQQQQKLHECSGAKLCKSHLSEIMTFHSIDVAVVVMVAFSSCARILGECLTIHSLSTLQKKKWRFVHTN